ncbi:MAG: hypothetical protein MJ121_00215 [Clostridia bacterium]|nr:hypothetical protein [Clostridia bacterium]
MTVKDILATGNFTAISLPDEGREINGVYIGDLLSWVMGRAQADNAWITIMSNINIVAVASLADVACIILAEGVTVDETIKTTAEAKDVNIISTSMPAYEAAMELAKMTV